MKIFNQIYSLSSMQLNNNNSDRAAMTNPLKLNTLTKDTVSFTGKTDAVAKVAEEVAGAAINLSRKGLADLLNR